jgi:hypothetical protein
LGEVFSEARIEVKHSEMFIFQGTENQFFFKCKTRTLLMKSPVSINVESAEAICEPSGMPLQSGLVKQADVFIIPSQETNN